MEKELTKWIIAVWLKMWAEDEQASLGYYMGVFTALIVGGVSLLGGICV